MKFFLNGQEVPPTQDLEASVRQVWPVDFYPPTNEPVNRKTRRGNPEAILKMSAYVGQGKVAGLESTLGCDKKGYLTALKARLPEQNPDLAYRVKAFELELVAECQGPLVSLSLEAALDELCQQSQSDRFALRMQNTLYPDLLKTLEDDFYRADFVGVAMGIGHGGVATAQLAILNRKGCLVRLLSAQAEGSQHICTLPTAAAIASAYRAYNQLKPRIDER